MNAPVLTDALPAKTDPGALQDAVVFLARFLDRPVQPQRVAELLAATGSDKVAAMRQALAAAGLEATPLPGNAPRHASEMPALALTPGGEAVVVVAMANNTFKCRLPGWRNTCWLSLEDLTADYPELQWLAVRATVPLDQRSQLYGLPKTNQWFWDVFNRNRPALRWALVGTLMINVFGALTPFYTMAVYDRVVPNNATSSLWALTIAVVLVTGFELLMRVTRGSLVESVARRTDVALSWQIFDRVLRLRAASRPASGGALANTIRDFETVREFFATGTLTVLGDLPFVFLFLAIIALVGGWLVLVPVAFVPVVLITAWLAQRSLIDKVTLGAKASAQRTAHLFESMNGLDTIKALGAEGWSRRKWEGLTQAIAYNSFETRELASRVNYINASILSLSSVVVVFIGAMMIGEHLITMGQLIAVSMLTSRALTPVNQIASLIVRWQQTKLSFHALDQIMSAPTDDAQATLTAPKLMGDIRFHDVDFAYPNQPKLLDRFNLGIAAGDRVGIIGKLGSGKSSLLRLILNQYQPDAGTVRVDGLVNTQVDPHSLRAQIGYVPQDVSLFHGTIRENIELGRMEGDDEALVDAMRMSCLDQVISDLSAGMGTQVGERGERLSGGQRQAVAIARALVTRPPILLMDEPSSMMDPATEQKLIARLRSLEDTTIIVVTHRMAMLSMIDRLVVLEAGRVIADGPRDAVLQHLAQTGAKVTPVRPNAGFAAAKRVV